MEKKILPFIMILFLLVGCFESLKQVSDTNDMMGTVVTITVYDADESKAREGIDLAFREIERVEKILSSYDENSEISKLNKYKKIDNPSVEVRENIEKAAYYGKLSDGGFDITVQPILDLYTDSFSIEKRPPTEEEILKELEKVDYNRVEIEDEIIKIGKDQKVTLGGIAKGYAVYKAVEVLKKEGIEHALVNAGGDIMAIGNKGSSDWNVALANPRDKNDYISIVQLSDKAIVTSGDYERYFDDSKKFHHIVNPKTGYSATELISVTILAENAFDADAISTSVFVMGKEEGMDLIESLEGVEGLIITSEKEILKSSGWD